MLLRLAASFKSLLTIGLAFGPHIIDGPLSRYNFGSVIFLSLPGVSVARVVSTAMAISGLMAPAAAVAPRDPISSCVVLTQYRATSIPLSAQIFAVCIIT